MIINNIEITNFRCYYGVNKMTFASDNKVTLIYGESGFGKTSMLQFLNWMLYGKCDFGKNNDKPFFNISAYKEAKIGDKLKVAGQIDFEHLGSKYRLNRMRQYYVEADMMNCLAASAEVCELQVKTEGDPGYHPFKGDIANQINKILPNELSKYFLLYGEESRSIVLDSNELKKAIHSLFGIDAYSDAISHIGNSNAKTTVLGHYATQLTKELGTVGNLQLGDMQDDIQELYDEIDGLSAKSKDLTKKISVKKDERDELLKTLGQVDSKSNIEAFIKLSQKAIDDNEGKIRDYQHEIGNIFYSTYPYLFLAQAIKETADVLKNKKVEYVDSYQSVFVNLKKNLLAEILEKNVCVCGRELDDSAKRQISAVMDIMPPNSYIYEFGQFISKSKNKISEARRDVLKYNDSLLKISEAQEQINDLDSSKNDKMEELKRMEAAKDVVEKLEEVNKEIKYLESQRNILTGKISEKKLVYNRSNKMLQDAIKKSNKANIYKNDMDFFFHISERLDADKKLMEMKVRNTLNECVRAVFKQLTTQTDLDVDSIQFINDDFSLRTTYLTGGQLSVDVYSYVIGIVKALQECKMDTNENPIIVDAPFAFTDNVQSEHIFRTLPQVSKQTILLTLDLNKISNALADKDLYDFYVIQNETQEKATIVRGDIDAIKF